MVFYVYYVNSKRHFKIIDGYWKLPRAPEGEQLSVETTISHITETDGIIANSALFDEETMGIIKSQFEQQIAPLLDHTFSLDGKEILLNMLRSDNLLEQAYAINELPKLIGSFYDLSDCLQRTHVPEYLLNVLQTNFERAVYYENLHFIFSQIFLSYEYLNKVQKDDFLELVNDKYSRLNFTVYNGISTFYGEILSFLQQSAPNFDVSKLADCIIRAKKQKEFIYDCIKSNKAICAATDDYLHRNTRIGHDKYQDTGDSIAIGLKLFGTFGIYAIRRSTKYDYRMKAAICYSEAMILDSNAYFPKGPNTDIMKKHLETESTWYGLGISSDIKDMLVLNYLLNDGQGGNGLNSLNYLLTSHFSCQTADSDDVAKAMVNRLKSKLQDHLSLAQEVHPCPIQNN